MRVAVIGAGLSGLACAYTLERNGIYPVIFEKSSQVGLGSAFSALWAKSLLRISGDPIHYLKKKYDFEILPMSVLKENTIISDNESATIRGDLGYIYKRGTEPHTLECQIAAKLKTPITFNSYIEIDDIKDDFDHIVVATATSAIPRKLSVWTSTFVCQTRTAVVVGEFKTDSATLWFNEKYANKAFGYLIPNSPKEATLALIVDGHTHAEMDFFWDCFLAHERLDYHITQISDAPHECGFVSHLQAGNVYFVGNAAGLTDDFIGIGGLNAIESGIMAAQAIAQGYNYPALAKPIYKDMDKIHEFRKALNTLDNRSLDNMVSFIDLPGIRQLLSGGAFFKLKHFWPAAKLYNTLKDKQ